jgi:hypothetical protein
LMVTNRIGHEHYDYLHYDALADLLEDLGVIWADEPKVLVEGQPPTESWSYKLPNGTTGSRDSRWLSANEVGRHYSHKMFRREEFENGLTEWQIWKEAGSRNIYDPFQELRRALAKAEIKAFCRSKVGLPKGWVSLFLMFFDAVRVIIDMFNRYLEDPRPTEKANRQEIVKLGTQLDRRKEGAIFFAHELAKSADLRGLEEDYFRSVKILDSVEHVMYALRGLIFTPRPDDPK